MKSSVVRYVVVSVSVILLCSVAFCFLLFKTDIVYNIDTDVSNRVITYDRTSVSTVISTVDEEEAQPGINDPNVNVPGVQYNPSGEWYSSVPDSMKQPGTVARTITMTSGETVNLYNALPWAPSDTAYIYNCTVAAQDTATFWNTKAGADLGLDTTSVFVYEFGSGRGSTTTIDGVSCVKFAPVPSVVDRNYCNAFTSQTWYTTSTPPASMYGKGTRKYCIILKDKDTGETFYCPASAADAKGHTFPGGTMQTHMQVAGAATSDAGPFTLNFGDRGPRARTTAWSEFPTLLDSLNPEPRYGSMLRAYIKINVELYSASKDDCIAFNRYSVAGFVAW